MWPKLICPDFGRATEAHNTGAADGSVALMVMAFEYAGHPVDAWMNPHWRSAATMVASLKLVAAPMRGRPVAQRLHPHAICARASDPAPSSTTRRGSPSRLPP
jgi:hypothetical protein